MEIVNLPKSSVKETDPLTIGINAQLVGGQAGGIEQAVIGLAAGLSRLHNSQDRFLFHTIPGKDEWLRPYVSGPCEIVHPGTENFRPFQDVKAHIKSLVPGLIRSLDPVRKHIPVSIDRPMTSWSDGTLEEAGSQVIHFPYQNGFRTAVPTIFQPWDLQHLHLPELFSKKQRDVRDVRYRILCEHARVVVVATNWGKADLVRHYGVDPGKIAVVHMAPPTNVYPVPSNDEINAIRKKLNLPSSFLFYPAQTFPHKNHIGLIDAIAYLRRERDMVIPVVFTGKMNDFAPTIERHARQAGVWDQLTFLGFVTPLEIQAIYRLSQGMIFPSKFEGWGLPVTEAFQIGTPVACSNATCLPEQVGDAALLFDPNSTGSIAEAVLRLWTDPQLREELKSRGTLRVAQFTWDSVARNMRILYGVTAGQPVSTSDTDRIIQMFGKETPQ